MTAIRGNDYIERLKKNPPGTWIGNELVKDPTTHPVIAPVIRSTANIYDLQWEPAVRDHMLYIEPTTGEWTGTQYMIPRSIEDLKTRRKMHRTWAETSYGYMGRSTDFMSAMLLGWYINADYFGEYAENVRNYFNYIRDNDLSLTHVLINPQVDRTQSASNQPDEFTYLGVVRETEEGIIVRGAKMLATAGPYTDEVLIFPLLPLPRAHQKPVEEEQKYAISFAIPMSTPGLKCIAREPYAINDKMDSPLSSQYDELDGVLIFDDVLVPWERVFIYKDIHQVAGIRGFSTFYTGHQTSTRLLTKLQFVAGVAMKATEMVKTNQFPHVADMIGEITTYIELTKAALEASESNALQTKDGFYYPNYRPLNAIRNSGNRWYPRVREIIQQILAGGLMYQPASMNIMDSPLKELIQKYYRGADVNAEEKMQIYKIAADIAVSAFGSRHELYERFYAGDPLFLRVETQYRNYDKTQCLELVEKMFKDLNVKLSKTLV